MATWTEKVAFQLAPHLPWSDLGNSWQPNSADSSSAQLIHLRYIVSLFFQYFFQPDSYIIKFKNPLLLTLKVEFILLKRWQWPWVKMGIITGGRKPEMALPGARWTLQAISWGSCWWRCKWLASRWHSSRDDRSMSQFTANVKISWDVVGWQ